MIGIQRAISLVTRAARQPLRRFLHREERPDLTDELLPRGVGGKRYMVLRFQAHELGTWNRGGKPAPLVEGHRTVVAAVQDKGWDGYLWQ
jgi:hypothetical protein